MSARKDYNLLQPVVPFLEFVERLLGESSIERQTLNKSKPDCTSTCDFRPHSRVPLEHYRRIAAGPIPHLVLFCWKCGVVFDTGIAAHESHLF
jgi:hypothetical protein